MRAGTTDDEMVVDRDPDRLRSPGDVQRDSDIGARRHRIAPGMVMGEDHGRSAKLQGALDHFSDVDRRVIDGALPLPFMLQQSVLAVEEENMKLLDGAVRDVGRAVVEEFL